MDTWIWKNCFRETGAETNCCVPAPRSKSLLNTIKQHSASLQLVDGEAATVVVVHTVPALRVTVGAELGVAAGAVVKALHPAFRVPHNQSHGVRGDALPGTRSPAVTSLPALVGDPQPALGHTLFSTENPPVALGEGGAHGETGFQP